MGCFSVHHLLLPPLLLSLLQSIIICLAFAQQPLPQQQQQQQQQQQLDFTDKNTSMLGRSHTIIFHVPSGLCILRKLWSDPLKLGACEQSDPWIYTPQGFLEIKGTYFCLQADQPGKPVNLGIICQPSDSQWLLIQSDSRKKTRLATKLADGVLACLDVETDGIIISNICNRFEASQEEHLESDTQWFNLVSVKKKASQAVDSI